MARTIIGLFTDTQDATKAINTLEREGVAPDDIGIVASDEIDIEGIEVKKESRTAEGASIGMGAGGAAGALIAGLTSVGVVTTGGAGLLAAGPIVAAFAGAGAGAAGGSVLGVLVGLGIDKDEAKVVDEEIRNGAVLVAAPPQADGADVAKIFNNAGAKRVFAE